ncbi:hypothetical protein Ddep01_00198 [Deinococcus depolymerans]
MRSVAEQGVESLLGVGVRGQVPGVDEAVGADPTADIRATRGVRLVVQAGRCVDPVVLRAALEA